MKVLITGRAGSGKSAVMGEVRKRGYEAYDVGEVPSLCSWRDLQTVKPATVDPRSPLDIDRYCWTINDRNFRDFVAAHEDFFICVGAAGELDYTDLFDDSFVLDVPSEVHLRRLVARTNNPYGKDPDMAQKIVTHQARLLKDAKQRGFIAIGTDRPIDEVVDEILAIAHVG